jgi:hypothetical protein
MSFTMLLRRFWAWATKRSAPECSGVELRGLGVYGVVADAVMTQEAPSLLALCQLFAEVGYCEIHRLGLEVLDISNATSVLRRVACDGATATSSTMSSSASRNEGRHK